MKITSPHASGNNVFSSRKISLCVAASMVSPQDKYHSIAPGQTITFEFTLNYPGVFMYHCGTPMILEHIASGMYGAIVDKGSARVSAESASLSAAFDPAHAPIAGMERALSRKLAARGLSIRIMCVMDKLAELKPVGKC